MKDNTMQYVSQVVNSSELESIINLPLEYRNRKVEVFVVPAKDQPTIGITNNSMYGILSKYSKADFNTIEKDAWELAMKEKYGNS